MTYHELSCSLTDSFGSTFQMISSGCTNTEGHDVIRHHTRFVKEIFAFGADISLFGLLAVENKYDNADFFQALFTFSVKLTFLHLNLLQLSWLSSLYVCILVWIELIRWNQTYWSILTPMFQENVTDLRYVNEPVYYFGGKCFL